MLTGRREIIRRVMSRQPINMLIFQRLLCSSLLFLVQLRACLKLCLGFSFFDRESGMGEENSDLINRELKYRLQYCSARNEQRNRGPEMGR